MVLAQKVVREVSAVSRNTAASRFKAEMECRCEGRCRLACTPERFDGVPAADEETVRSLSAQLNNQIQRAADKDLEVTGSASTAALSSTPSELFKQMDLDGAGNIAFYDFAAMVRKELLVPQAEVSTETLIGGWKALDKNPTGQGRIDVDKFGRFINKGRAQRMRRSRTASRDEVGSPPPP